MRFESLEDRQMLSGTELLDHGSLIWTEPLPISSDTGEKPQSKVWQHDDHWWSVLPNDNGTWLWRLDGANWTALLQLSSETDINADVKTDGEVAHVLLFDGSASRLVSLEHMTDGSNSYGLWSLRPTSVDITLHSDVETATIDIDSTGRMWVASDTRNDVEVRYSDYPYTTFSDPVTVASGISSDDIALIIALPNGTVVYSGQTRTANGLAFACTPMVRTRLLGALTRYPQGSRLCPPEPGWPMII